MRQINRKYKGVKFSSYRKLMMSVGTSTIHLILAQADKPHFQTNPLLAA